MRVYSPGEETCELDGLILSVIGSMDAGLLPANADYYLCGPMPFMAEQHKALVARGIPAENIHSEAFGTGGVKLS